MHGKASGVGGEKVGSTSAAKKSAFAAGGIKAHLLFWTLSTGKSCG